MMPRRMATATGTPMTGSGRITPCASLGPVGRAVDRAQVGDEPVVTFFASDGNHQD